MYLCLTGASVLVSYIAQLRQDSSLAFNLCDWVIHNFGRRHSLHLSAKCCLKSVHNSCGTDTWIGVELVHPLFTKLFDVDEGELRVHGFDCC